MPALENSTRTLNRATYAPLNLRNSDARSETGRALDKWSFASMLSPTKAEFAKIRDRLTNAGNEAGRARLEDINKLEALIVRQTGAASHASLTAMQAFRDIPASLLSRFGEELGRLREFSKGSAASGKPEGHGMQPWTVKQLTEYFSARIASEPVGYLHLERLSFVPAGIERGELIYSVPLSPGEEVNISHKEWSNTSEEFERIVTDYLEGYSEEGVAEKSEITQSVASQQQHSTNWNLGVTASGSYGPVTLSTNFGLSVADSATRTEALARNQSSELTRKASSRVTKEHKTSFKVASAAGTEDQAIRKIRNTFSDKATRIDYYQLVRKWRVDLHRYGVRLTYDLVIPEPGLGILRKIYEIRQLTGALQQGFGDPSATSPWARFDLTPGEIARENYFRYAAEYGIALEAPPPIEVSQLLQFSHSWNSEDDAEQKELISFDTPIPSGYFISAFELLETPDFQSWGLGTAVFSLLTKYSEFLGTRSDTVACVTLVYLAQHLQYFQAQWQVKFQRTQEAEKEWKMKCWGVLRDAAKARYEANRSSIKDQLTKLQEALGAQDPLSLRKVEREEVMKGVLRWLFGPTFVFAPEGVPWFPYDTTTSGAVVDEEVWSKVLAQGEVIKFLHHAVEWENMLYFLYPYFWSHTKLWEFKKYLHHPDFMHRTFLKSGAARVVLSIRPGYERDLMSFLETGTTAGLAEGHPYLTIAQEMEAFAQTNYPGIRAANPVESARPLLTPRQRRTWEEMQGIMAALEEYKAKHGGQYPTSAQGLAVLPGRGGGEKDPFGNAYQYRSPGRRAPYELESLGADGKPGGEDEDADIASWAEASLIGQWFEYTPTSALDVAFNEALPPA